MPRSIQFWMFKCFRKLVQLLLAHSDDSAGSTPVGHGVNDVSEDFAGKLGFDAEVGGYTGAHPRDNASLTHPVQAFGSIAAWFIHG